MKAIIDYLSRLPLVGGDHDGECFKVLRWERRFIMGAFSQSADAALTVARGNGKSAVVAGLACCVVDPEGPLHARRRDVDVFGSSLEQGRIIFSDVLASLGEKYDLDARKVWKKQDTGNHCVLEHRPSGARVRCLGSNPKRAHGLRSWLALLDEPSQWETAKRDAMLSAIRTGLGKSPGSRLIMLGTKPADGQHFFSRMLRTAGYFQEHVVPVDTPAKDLFKVATIRRANPSWAHLPSLQARIKQEAREARIDPDSLASFKGLRLNMGVSDTVEAMLIGPETWERITKLARVEPAGRFALGIDLGTTAAMSAAAGFWPETGYADVFACLPNNPTLAEKGLLDGVGNLYVQQWKRNELLLEGEFVSDVQALLREVLRRWGRPSVIVCDRWREGDLREALAAINFPVVPLVIRGMGFKDGSDDLRQMKRVALAGRMRPAPSLLLASALSEARTVSDPAGNIKLSKNTQGGRRSKARDDAAAALILAVSEGERRSAGHEQAANDDRPLMEIVR